jgi:hypothetical protein
MTQGVITGCTHDHEWLLPWWWMHYAMHTNIPVTFFDFGDMTPEAKSWCEKRGELKSLPALQGITSEDQIDAGKASLWRERKTPDLWKARLGWFQKPFACLHSPYQKSLWLDLDCQVRRSLEPLFSQPENEWGLSLVEESHPVQENHRQAGMRLPDEVEYNTRVILFQQEAPLLQEWSHLCLERNLNLRGDQEALARLLHEKRIRLPSLSARFNTSIQFIPETSRLTDWDEAALILHWVGLGKEFLKLQIDLLKKHAFMNFNLA